MFNKVTAALLFGATVLIATPAYAQTSEPQEQADIVTDDIYSESAYEQFVSLCHSQVDRSNYWLLSSEEKRSVCSDSLVAEASTWSNFLSSDSYGKYPIHSYQIFSDDGRFYNVMRQIRDFITGFLFALVVLLTALATVLVEFAYEFKIVSWLSDTVGDLSNQYLGGLGYGSDSSLFVTALFLTTFVAGLHALRGRMTKAGSELFGGYLAAFALALVVALGGFLGPVLGLFETTLEISEELTATVLQPHQHCLPPSGEPDAVTFVQNPVVQQLIERGTLKQAEPAIVSPVFKSQTASEPTKGLVVCTAATTLQQSFVAEPYDYIQWGADLDTEEFANCAIARDIILSRNWTSDDPEPRFLMRNAGPQCRQFAEFNHDPSMERMSMAFVALLVSLLGLAVVFWVLVQLLVAQVKLLFVIATGAWAFLSGMAPSVLRGGFYGWINALTRSLLDLVVVSLFLAIYLSVMSAVSASKDIEWATKSVFMCVTSIGFFISKNKIMAKSKDLASTATRTVSKSPAVEPQAIQIVDAAHKRSESTVRSLPRKMVERKMADPRSLPNTAKRIHERVKSTP